MLSGATWIGLRPAATHEIHRTFDDEDWDCGIRLRWWNRRAPIKHRAVLLHETVEFHSMLGEKLAVARCKVGLLHPVEQSEAELPVVMPGSINHAVQVGAFFKGS